MKIRPTQGISYPRSGHEIVFHIVRRYFGNELVYCDVNNTNFCGCESVPCVNPARTFSKCHDFGLRRGSGIPIDPLEHYFIQYRNPVRSIASNFHLHLRGFPNDDHLEGWQAFASREIAIWNRFVDKWILNFPEVESPPCVCAYESLMTNPRQRVREILQFMSEEPIDEMAIDEILKIISIAPRDNLASFKYYDPDFMRHLEAQTYGRLRQLELPSFLEESRPANH